jgi:LEA14-like dessication related protein
MRKGLLFLVVAVMLSGCAGMGVGLEPPRVQVADIRVQEVKALESVFQIQLRVLNPNDEAFEVSGLDCELQVNSKRFATGVSDVKTRIPPYGTAIIPVMVYSSVVDVLRGVLGLQGSEALNYKLTGKISVKGDTFGSTRIPFESEGELNIKGLGQTQ